MESLDVFNRKEQEKPLNTQKNKEEPYQVKPKKVLSTNVKRMHTIVKGNQETISKEPIHIDNSKNFSVSNSESITTPKEEWHAHIFQLLHEYGGNDLLDLVFRHFRPSAHNKFCNNNRLVDMGFANLFNLSLCDRFLHKIVGTVEMLAKTMIKRGYIVWDHIYFIKAEEPPSSSIKNNDITNSVSRGKYIPRQGKDERFTQKNHLHCKCEESFRRFSKWMLWLLFSFDVRVRRKPDLLEYDCRYLYLFRLPTRLADTSWERMFPSVHSLVHKGFLDSFDPAGIQSILDFAIWTERKYHRLEDDHFYLLDQEESKKRKKIDINNTFPNVSFPLLSLASLEGEEKIGEKELDLMTALPNFLVPSDEAEYDKYKRTRNGTKHVAIDYEHYQQKYNHDRLKTSKSVVDDNLTIHTTINGNKSSERTRRNNKKSKHRIRDTMAALNRRNGFDLDMCRLATTVSFLAKLINFRIHIALWKDDVRSFKYYCTEYPPFVLPSFFHSPPSTQNSYCNLEFESLMMEAVKSDSKEILDLLMYSVITWYDLCKDGDSKKFLESEGYCLLNAIYIAGTPEQLDWYMKERNYPQPSPSDTVEFKQNLREVILPARIEEASQKLEKEIHKTFSNYWGSGWILKGMNHDLQELYKKNGYSNTNRNNTPHPPPLQHPPPMFIHDNNNKEDGLLKRKKLSNEVLLMKLSTEDKHYHHLYNDEDSESYSCNESDDESSDGTEMMPKQKEDEMLTHYHEPMDDDDVGGINL